MKFVELTFILLALVCFTTAQVKYSKDFFTNILDNLPSPVTQKCQQQFKEFVANLSTDGTSWAQQMVDGNSEIPVGTVTLNFEDMGDFHQCVDVKANTEAGNISGKYCLGYVSVTNKSSLLIRESVSRIPPLWSICVPNGCTTDDTNTIGDAVLANLLDSEEIHVGFSDLLCQTIKEAKPELSTAAIVTIVILAILLLLVLLATFYDIYSIFYGTTKCPVVVKGFSIYTNSKNIFNLKKPNPDHLSCLDGLRSISMIWVVIIHQFGTPMSGPLTNTNYLTDWSNKLESMFIINGSFSVDTFFTIGGALLSFGFMKSRHRKAPFNLFWFYVHRYVRLTAAFIPVILVSATLLVYMGSGPTWPYLVLYFQKNCENNWWLALLYVQNYVNNTKMCVGQTWYLNVDMQLYLISPILLYALWKYPKFGLSFLGACALASMGLAFYAIWKYNMPGFQFGIFRASSDFQPKYFLLTHTRASPWIIGVIVGYFIYKIKQNQINLKLNKYFLAFTWAVCFGTLLACVLGGQDIFLHRVEDYDVWANALFAALTRPAWSIAVGWIILTCITNYGGPVNWILSLPIFQVFNKLSYSIYLIHVTVLYAVAYDRKKPEYFSDFYMICEFWGTLWLSIGLSILLVLMAESPLITIEKVLEDKFNNKR